MDIKIHEANTSPYYLDAKRPSLRHIIIKLSKIKKKRKRFKATREGKSLHAWEPPLDYQGFSQQKSSSQGESGMIYSM